MQMEEDEQYQALIGAGNGGGGVYIPDSYDESEIYVRGTINQSLNGSNLNQMFMNQNKLQ
jgi:hypothetical protein